jgi:hypothetical protein
VSRVVRVFEPKQARAGHANRGFRAGAIAPRRAGLDRAG